MQAEQRQPIENFCCQNKDCPEAGKRGAGNVYFRGWSGRGKRIRMAYCKTCKRSFSQRKGTPLEDSRLPEGKAISLLEHIKEGTGTRATSRLVKVDKNTVTRYIGLAGSHAEKLHPELVAFSPSDP